MISFFLDTLNTNLQIHSNTGATDFWLEPGIEGLDAPDYRTNEYEKPGEDGTNVSSQFYGSRVVNLPGYIKGPDPTAFAANRRSFLTATQVRRDSFGAPIARRCRFTDMSGSTYFFDAYVKTKPRLTEINAVTCRYLLQLTVPGALIYSTTQVASSPITRPTGGGFILPVVLPIVSSSQTGGTIVVNNVGNETVKPIITITGPALNPYISNAALGGKYVQLNATLGAGDIAVIDMAEKSIVLNDSSPYLSKRADGSEWWGIAPGSNPLSFSTGSTSDTGTMTVKFYPGYTGV